jgi:hypothetical protein
MTVLVRIDEELCMESRCTYSGEKFQVGLKLAATFSNTAYIVANNHETVELTV